MIDKEMLEQFQMLAQAMNAMENRLNKRINEKIDQSESRIMVYIENNVAKRMDALFDGYKLNHEMQWELEKKTATLEQQLQELQARLTIIESKIA